MTSKNTRGLFPGGARHKREENHHRGALACSFTGCRYNTHGTCLDWRLYHITDTDALGTDTTRLCFTAPDETH